MKRIVLLSAFIFMVFIAGAFAQDPVQPEITAPQETKSEVKKADKAKEATVPFTIGEIVVRDRAVPNIEDASTTTEIDGKDIDNRGDRSLADSLQMVPGVSVESTAKGFTGLSMRGFDHERVAILIDGIPVLDPYYGGNNIDISSIPVDFVSRIVVNRGAASSLYGALGSVGSINIITRLPEKLTASAKVEYGEHQNWMVNASAGAPIGNFYAWITASVQNSNGYEISEKLDRSERKSWFDKLVSYQVYGKNFNDITLKSVPAYLNDDNVWNHTSYRKYLVSGRTGYHITNNMEAGLSASYYTNEQESNTFQDGSLASWDPTPRTGDPNWGIPEDTDDYDTDGKSAVFQNRAFYWPEDTRMTVSPYFKGEFGDLSLRVNTFYIAQKNVLEGYATQDHSINMFPPSTYRTTGGSPSFRPPYFDDDVQSIYEETSYGIYLLPTYRIARWNKLSTAVHYRVEIHEKYEKAMSATLAPGVVSVHGTGEYIVHDMEASYITIALEDEMRFSTGFGSLVLTAGLSYDAQSIDHLETISRSDGTLNQMVDTFFADEDSMLWGTRDSFNPVLSVVYDPIKDFLRFRAAGAIKTNFPNLDIYSDITDATDIQVNPERVYSSNIGFELFFLNNTISFRNDYFYTQVKDKIEEIYTSSGEELYDNIDGVTTQGIESILQARFERLGGIMDLQMSLGYVFLNATNDDTSYLSYGEEVENIPQHQFIAQVVLDFVTKTRLMLWGNHTRNQIKYVMAGNPPTVPLLVPYSSEYYKTVELHNPFMLHMKVQQELPFNTYLYVMCKNVLDDYNADPFNPGPGRMFYFGGGGRL